MITEGDMALDPRTQILDDLRKLITEKRAEGLRPILMMDANDDWVRPEGKSFAAFIEEMKLVDPLHKHFKNARGTKRIDYMLVDEFVDQAIIRIGTLGLHEGIIFDHVMLYMDIDERQLFGGIINRPVLHPSREFTIEHADKMEKFLAKFKHYAKEKKFAERVGKLRNQFRTYGSTTQNVKTYNNLDIEIKECLLSAAATVAKKKF
ncbi:hypothetical protein ACHAWF_000158, partial [Thalassiosira exigua]